MIFMNSTTGNLVELTINDENGCEMTAEYMELDSNDDVIKDELSGNYTVTDEVYQQWGEIAEDVDNMHGAIATMKNGDEYDHMMLEFIQDQYKHDGNDVKAEYITGDIYDYIRFSQDTASNQIRFGGEFIPENISIVKVVDGNDMTSGVAYDDDAVYAVISACIGKNAFNVEVHWDKESHDYSVVDANNSLHTAFINALSSHATERGLLTTDDSTKELQALAPQFIEFATRFGETHIKKHLITTNTNSAA